MIDKLDEIEKIKQKVAELIINFNLIEGRVSELIVLYLQSKQSEFLTEVVLNSLFVNMASKVKILEVIKNKEKFEVTKIFFPSLRTLMEKRNIIAHSDSLDKISLYLVDIDYNWERDGVDILPDFEYDEPYIRIIKNGQVDFEVLGKVIGDFERNYGAVSKELTTIREQIVNKIISPDRPDL